MAKRPNVLCPSCKGAAVKMKPQAKVKMVYDPVSKRPVPKTETVLVPDACGACGGTGMVPG